MQEPFPALNLSPIQLTDKFQMDKSSFDATLDFVSRHLGVVQADIEQRERSARG